jgi:hypothetical protein
MRIPTPARQNALTASSWTRTAISPAPGFAVTSSRLLVPKPPNAIRTSWSVIAVTYATTISTRSNRVSSRPVGNARKTCRKSTGGNRSRAWPTEKVTSFVVHDSVTSALTNPAVIMSGPKRLEGLRDQASSPPRTYETVIQLPRKAMTSGSPSWPSTASLVKASVNAHAAAAEPPSAIAHSQTGLGGRGESRLAACAAANAAVAVAPSDPRVAVDRRDLSGASAIRPARARVKGGACHRGYSDCRSDSTSVYNRRGWSAQARSVGVGDR